MAREVVTLNIEDTRLRLMVSRNRKVRLAVTESLETGIVRNGTVLDRNKLAQAVAGLFRSQRVKSTRVIAAVSGASAFYRLVSIPPVPPAMLAEAVRREGERVMPVSVSELYLSYQVLARSHRDTLLCIVGVTRRPIETQVQAMKEAGLSPFMMDVKPLAMARAVNEPEGILIDVQDGTFDIALVVNGLPQVIRSLPFSKLNLSLAEKEPAIREEMERIVKFYNSTHKDRPLQASIPLFLSGEIDDEAATQLGNSLGYSNKPLPQVPFELHGLDIRPYLVNFGLALKATDAADRIAGMNLNVLPEIYFRRKLPLAQFAAVAFLLAGVAGAVWAYGAVDRARQETKTMRSELVQIQDAARTRASQATQLAELQQKTAALKPLATAWDSVLGNLQQTRREASKNLIQAVDAAGQSITIDHIDYGTASGLVIHGSAATKEEVLAYAKRLRETGDFAYTLVNSVEDNPSKTAVEFALELQ
jgi:hypothetical protein